MMCLKIDTAVTTDNPYDDSHINVYFPLTKIWLYIEREHNMLRLSTINTNTTNFDKGLRMDADAFWRSGIRRVVPWSETLHAPQASAGM